MDMAGNVYEWINDWYDSVYYSYSPYSNPPGPETGTLKVVRGARWFYWDINMRVAFRGYYNQSNQHEVHGFRCAALPEK